MRRISVLTIMAAAALMPPVAAAQSPPEAKTPAAPKTELTDPKACAPSNRATVGQGGAVDVQKPDGRSLSDQLAQSGGVICPPANMDPEIRQPAPGGGRMPVIPPPGSPGGDPSVQPK